MKKRKTPYKLDDRLTFGQYRGKLIAKVIETDTKKKQEAAQAGKPAI